VVTADSEQLMKCIEKLVMSITSQGVLGSLFKSIQVLRNVVVQEMADFWTVGETSLSPVAFATGSTN